MSHDLILSLTHDAMISHKKIVGIGIDVEETRKIDIRVSKYFVTENEQNFFDIQNEQDVLTLWTIKEALYKATPDNEGLVLSDFVINSIKNGSGRASCTKRETVKYTFSSKRAAQSTTTVALCLEDE